MSKKKILVVDDDVAIVKIMSFQLKKKGYDVITASNGRSCIRKAAKEKPDLILLDILMPKLNGFEICSLLKKDKKTKEIPVIMLTALAEEKDLSSGLMEGAVCFISKPFSYNDLLQEVKITLGK